MFEDQFSNAEGHLEYSLRHCYKGAYLNKRRILEYLIPVKMLRGRLPSLKREYKATDGNDGGNVLWII